MKFPKVEFITDTDEQAKYICFLAKAIQKGYYQDLGFLVIPYQPVRNRASVFFPKFSYSSHFWQAITKCKNENLGETFPRECIEEVKTHLKTSNWALSPKRSQEIITKWKKTEKNFFLLVKDFLDLEEVIAQLAKIEVLLTNFGTCGSFYPHQEKEEIKIIASQRQDFSTIELARTLLLCFYRIKTKRKMIKGLPWWQRKAVVDYLLGETSFHRLFPDYQPQKEILDDKKANKLITESQNFLVELGFPQQPILGLDKAEKLIIKGREYLNLFTNQEKEILKTLIRNRGQLVSYDELAETIWKEDAFEKFSLYALTKSIQNIRRKLMETGIYKNPVVTVRKQGYALND